MMRRPAFTLIEMLAVMILLAVVTGIMGMLLRETLNVERAQANGFDNILHVNALADQFRADVAQARDAPAAWDNYRADQSTLILALPDGGHVVYLWQDGKLLRRALGKSGAGEHFLPVGSGNVAVRFVHDENTTQFVSLRIDTLRKGNALPGQTLEITAALAGDWR